MKAQIISYLNFNGKCREAMTFYQECLGGELEMQKISESPMAAQMPSEAGAHILHSKLVNDTIILMGSDMIGAGLIPGNAITLCLNCNDENEITNFFDKLSTGGQVKTPLHQTFWGATYGELTDKFGMLWMLNFSRN
ncbi:MAG TPA: VOC family protein [Cyclobacteriaceae bacterium]